MVTHRFFTHAAERIRAPCPTAMEIVDMLDAFAGSWESRARFPLVQRTAPYAYAEWRLVVVVVGYELLRECKISR